MVKKLHDISPDELLIHPGETILEIIQERGISQKELAIRSGFTEKHISTVINGQKNISAEFAQKLEYALGVPASFWRNLQTNYDLEVVAFNEKHNITNEEKIIAKEVIPTINKLTSANLKKNNGDESVYKIRKILGVSNLSALEPLSKAFYRAQFEKNTSEYIMYTWQYLCEKKAMDQTDNVLDIDRLKSNIKRIKMVMHDDSTKHISLIQAILNESGILFIVEDHVKGAPIKGLTVKTKKGQVLIALTIRGKYLDIFWFTLFHEIGHVLAGDHLKNQNDLAINDDIEKNADVFAANALIDQKQYNEFIKAKDFSLYSIKRFARKNDVLPTILIGRLMKENYIEWNSLPRDMYTWG